MLYLENYSMHTIVTTLYNNYHPTFSKLLFQTESTVEGTYSIYSSFNFENCKQSETMHERLRQKMTKCFHLNPYLSFTPNVQLSTRIARVMVWGAAETIYCIMSDI